MNKPGADHEIHGFRFNEKYLSQIPALQLLINLGFEYLPPARAMAERGGKAGNLLLEDILRDRLKAINRIRYKGGEYLFSEENVQSAVQKLKNVRFDGLRKTNEAIYDLITLGTALEQTVEGDSRSFNLDYIDWREPDGNSFHVTAEFSVERARGTETVRPDIVLFVNGIPFAVIECKSPRVEVEQAVSQSIRNQGDEYIPRLFAYAQMVMGINRNDALYATTGSPARFWGRWREQRDREAQVRSRIDGPLTDDRKDRLFSGEFASARGYFDALEAEGERLISEQDRALYSLCRPERLLELAYRFTAFEGGDRKIARYQQYFVIKSALERVRQPDGEGRRGGGVIWHTQFDKALNVRRYRDESADIFILVDESHRTNFGAFSARMRQMFPKACYLGFTGTPLLKEEKNSFRRFGGLIEPHYSINQAVEDRAVVPLLYEGRHVEMEQNKAVIDLWFERHTEDLTGEQKADLKKKYARAETLNSADRVIYMRAFDIGEHYRSNWQDTGFKAQLVAPNKVSALKYQKFLDEIGSVSSEVIISPPDSREGYEEVDDEPADEVARFWRKMMNRYGSEEEYVRRIVNRFKQGDEPEIIIVVDKLLTGFDAPRNAVLYLCRRLREHGLLQAIARVNRLFEGKDFGYIVDYASVLGELDRALGMYGALEGFDDEDLEGTLTSVREEVSKLPQRYSDLWDLFKKVGNRYDEEAYEVLLGDTALREEFYRRLADYAKTLGIALSTEQFVMETADDKLRRYKDDLKRFRNLRASVKLRYAEAIDYRDYEPRIRKLLDTHIQANEVTQLNEPVDILDEKTFSGVKEQQGVYRTRTTAARADTIAHATKKAITEKMEEDPAFYEKFSKLIQQAIDDFRARRISDMEYLDRVTEIRDKVATRRHDDVPRKLEGNEDAVAYYGILLPFFEGRQGSESAGEDIAADTALAIQSILRGHWKVRFWDDHDAQKRAMNDIDDYLYDQVKDRHGIELSPGRMDEIIERSMRIGRHRMRG